jgi:hypothetical protein
VVCKDVTPENKGHLEELLTKYWNRRLSNEPCNDVELIKGSFTIGENIPNYRFAYSDLVVARKSFTGHEMDPCNNENLITSRKITVNEGDKVNIVMGTSVFADRDDRYDIYSRRTDSKMLVEQEMEAVHFGQLSVTCNGQQLVTGNIDNYRVGPVQFSLEVGKESKVADRMEYPISKGTSYNAWTGGHCMVVEMDTPGSFQIRVDFDGVRGYKNRTITEIEVK